MNSFAHHSFYMGPILVLPYLVCVMKFIKCAIHSSFGSASVYREAEPLALLHRRRAPTDKVSLYAADAPALLRIPVDEQTINKQRESALQQRTQNIAFECGTKPKLRQTLHAEMKRPISESEEGGRPYHSLHDYPTEDLTIAGCSHHSEGTVPMQAANQSATQVSMDIAPTHTVDSCVSTYSTMFQEG